MPQEGDFLANLAVISYEKLLEKDPAEVAKLLSACAGWGFFYLDLSSNKAENYRHTVSALNGVSQEYFARPLEEKLKDTNEEWSVFNICGYKPRSLDTGNVAHKKDGCEGLRIPADLCFIPGNNAKLRRPDGINANWETFIRFIEESHSIGTLILSNLSDALGLEGESRYENLHRPGSSSNSTAVLQYYPHEVNLPQDTSVGHFTHTDTGSVTILFNTEWGLQVCSPDGERWEYVPPAGDDLAIVNIGDALRFFSGCKLRSCLHRVVPCHEKWRSGSRYATIFFLRPSNDAEFTDSEGQHWKARDWLNRKFLSYRVDHSEQKKSAIPTGRKGFVGLWDGPKISSTVLT